MGLLDEVKETFDEQPETVLADAGYCNERDLSALEARGIDVAPGREGKRTVNRDPHTHPATLVEKLATPTGRERYAQRKWLSEAPNGQGGSRLQAIQRAGSGQGARGLGVSGTSSVYKRFWRCEGPLFAGETRPESSGVLHLEPSHMLYAPTAVFQRVHPCVQPPLACLELPFYGAGS